METFFYRLTQIHLENGCLNGERVRISYNIRPALTGGLPLFARMRIDILAVQQNAHISSSKNERNIQTHVNCDIVRF